ncbi:MAG: hypothetical protein AB1390_12650 [Nitrospirota bacterium]
MDLGRAPKYSKNSTIDIYVYAAVNNIFLKSAIDQLSAGKIILNGERNSKRELKKVSDIQSLDTVLSRIEGKEPNEILKEMQHVNDEIIKKAVKEGEFEKGFDASLDSHNVYRYTKIKDSMKRKRKCDDIQKVVGTKPKNGCYYAHQYMTIKAVNGDFNPTLDTTPVLPFTNRVKPEWGLIHNAERKTKAEIDCLLGDGDLDNVDTINMCYGENKHFIFRADRDAKVQKIIREKCSGIWYHIEYGYTKGEGNHKAQYNLVIIDVNLLKMYNVEMPLMDKKEKYLVYATDLAPRRDESDMDFCISLVKRHKKRWGIETGYRDKIEFRAPTHALSYSVRLFFFLLSVILYNLWVEVNHETKDLPERHEMYPDGISKYLIGFLLMLAVLTSAHHFSKAHMG